jgi:glycerophosphoryl diester phosphodiesterase
MLRFSCPLLVLVLVLVLLTSSVQADSPFFAQPFLLGLHRGGSQWRPEHTVDTYLEAAQRWPHALLEMDVRITKDGVVVLHHDANVKRTTDGTGSIEEMTLEEVQALDAGYHFTSDDGQSFPYRGKGLRIATLDEVLSALPTARWLIEPKTDGPLVDAVAKVVQKHHAEQRVLLASFKPAVVERLKTLLPQSPTCFTMTSGMALFTALRTGGETWENYQPDDDVLSVSSGMLKQFNLTAEEFKQVQAKGIKVQLHTLNTEEQLRDGIAMGVDSILSDRPDIFAALLTP